jgi:DnaJ-domain-containing protein 1
MFLQLLRTDQQRQFLAAAQSFMAADGMDEALERAFLLSARQEMGWANEPPPPADLTALELTVFDTTVAKNVLVLELAGLCWIDGLFHKEEERLLRRLAEQLGVGDEQLDAILVFAQRARDLVSDGQQLVASGEG